MDAAVPHPPPGDSAGASPPPPGNSAMMSLWEAVDLCLRREGMTSDGGTERTDGTVVTNGTAGEDEGGFDLECAEEEESEGDEISIPAEVSLGENVQVHDRPWRWDDCEGAGESEEESDGEEDDGGWDGADDDEFDSSSECEADDASGGDGDTADFPSPTDGIGPPSPCDCPPHELFLPQDLPPSTEPLKYERDDDQSSDESSDEEDDDDASCHSHRTYMIRNGRGGRPRMWDGCSTTAACTPAEPKPFPRRPGGAKHKKPPKAGGVSFNDSVTVRPIFEIGDYPPSMVARMYTSCKDLRVNRQRNLREYAHDGYDWRNATEEDGMKPDEEGELVHPASRPAGKRKLLRFRPGSTNSGARAAKRTRTCDP